MKDKPRTILKKYRYDTPYTVLPNKLLQEHCKSLTPRELGILCHLLSRPEDWVIQLQNIADNFSNTGIKKVRTGINELIEKGFMKRDTERSENGQIIKHIYFVSVEPVFNKIKPLCPEGLVAEGLVAKGTLQNKDNNILYKQKKEDTNIVVSDETTEKITEIFNFWNSLGVIKHNKLTPTMRELLKKKLQDFSIDEIMSCLENYSLIVLGNEYWFNYKWGLTDFLKRKNGFDSWCEYSLEDLQRNYATYKPDFVVEKEKQETAKNDTHELFVADWKELVENRPPNNYRAIKVIEYGEKNGFMLRFGELPKPKEYYY